MYVFNSTSVNQPTPPRPAYRRHNISEDTLQDLLVPESIHVASIAEPYQDNGEQIK